MEKFNEHKELPWREYDKGIAKATEYGVDIIAPMVYAGYDRKFIVEACNNHYRLKEQNEKLLSALEKIENPILFLQKEAKSQGASLNGLMAVALSKDCEWLKSIASEAIKSCQP